MVLSDLKVFSGIPTCGFWATFHQFLDMDPGEAPGTSGDPPDPPEPMLAHGGEEFGQDLEGGSVIP